VIKRRTEEKKKGNGRNTSIFNAAKKNSRRTEGREGRKNGSTGNDIKKEKRANPLI